METVVNFIKQYVINPILAITLVDILDIVLLAFLFYFVYRFIRDRRAGKVALGVLLILFILIISSAFEMHAINFVLENFYQVGIMALLIVFQPELRAALEKVGATPMAGLKNIAEQKDAEQTAEAISAIADAACALSREKTGALIVIERSTKLGEYIKSGVVVNAQISSFLLRNIFFNKAPLHDGAVIVRDYRVYAAGCFLPLSTHTDIVKDLGTRHRAAIGMSEISDAVVIVVSEETGTISLAYEGTLRRNFSYRTLKQALLSILDPGGNTKGQGGGRPHLRFGRNKTENVSTSGDRQNEQSQAKEE
ncbi:MAG: TIGR00159 family protein [Ruminococcaceae bacterium]|nr:TIGR00159 family protein [Oscillospiraceae bacterium]